MWISVEAKRGRQKDGMATKTEGSELFGLPPRKRFKVMEQQRRREEQEEEEESSPRGVYGPCNDVTNRVSSPKKVTSQGFLLLEKQKYKLQQQENLVPALLPLPPPRPVAVKREAPAALPLSASAPSPTMTRLKFQGSEKAHSLSPSAFKSWGTSSPKLGFVPLASSSELPGSKKKSPKVPGHRLKRHVKAWNMAEATITCSINKAQEEEDVEMVVQCEIPVLSSSTRGSEFMHVHDDGSHVASDDHMVGAAAAQVLEADTKFPSSPVEDVLMQEVQDVEEEGRESEVATSTGIITAHLGCFAPLDDTDVADDDAQSSPGNTKIVVEAANVETPQDISGAMESEGDEGKELVEEVQDSEESATDRVHATNATLGVPEACFSQFTNPLRSPIVALVESHTSAAETSNISMTSEGFTVTADYTNMEDKTLLNPCDTAGGKTCSEGKHEEPAILVIMDKAVVCVDEASEVVENKEQRIVSTLGDSLTGEPDPVKQDRLRAKIDERAENLFKRMLEREGYERDDDSFSQFFLVNDVDSPVVAMEVEGGPPLTSQDPSTDHVICSEDFQIDLGRPTINVVVEGQIMRPEEMTNEMPDQSSSGASECSEDQDIDSPIPSALNFKHGSKKLNEKQFQESDCKSSIEDGDWDVEMEIPNFSFGKRRGMTQRVKAPGLWLQSSGGTDSTNLDEEGVADEDEEDEDEDDGACDICRNPDAEPSNPIVYCDGCDVPVHVDCYGNPLCHEVPEGDWFCAQCQNNRRQKSRSCCLCPRSGGAMKMTTDGNWAHLSCAVFVPEVFFRKADDLEGIDTSHVPSKRWLSTCCVCKSTGGACVDCTEIGCKSSFHVSCALKKDLALEFRNGRSGAIVISFCQKHTAAWDEQQEARKAGRSKYKIVSREPQRTKAAQRSKLR